MSQPSVNRHLTARWLSRAAVALVVVFLAAPRSAPAGDAVCWSCINWYKLPGNWIGAIRLERCPLCGEDPCSRADEIMARLKSEYRKLRDELADVQKKIGEYKLAGKPVPHPLSAREDYLLDPTYSPLVHLEREWEIIKKDCEKTGNIWGEGEGPIDKNPPGNDRERQRGRAVGAAGAYKQAANDEIAANDILSGFFGSSLPDFKSPAAAYQADRARVAGDYQKVAKRYEDAAAILGKPVEVPKPDADKTHTKEVKPDLAPVKPKEKATPNEKLAAETLTAKRNKVAYTLAYQDAVRRFRVAEAAGEKEAMNARSREARQFAWYARKWGEYGAYNDAVTAAAELKGLVSALETAAKAGKKLPDLLGEFQKGVKDNGLPAAYRDSLKAAGATEAELDAARKRLLDLTPEGVEAFLKARRAWTTSVIKSKVEDVVGADTPTLDVNYYAALSLFPEGHKKPEKK